MDYRPGTVLYFIGNVFFLTLPVVACMLFLGRGWRQSLELAIAMLVPVATTVVLGEMTRSPYLLWLVTAMYPAMSPGMLVYMLARRDVFGIASPRAARARDLQQPGRIALATRATH